ncbi:MAG TPA: tripartite tricarboxylate transporter substrate-binding protein, partial [Burkholderiales bacterium]|nr:tripartite tricarboxylate transporter substrate-binding protein [Burkholderiales bacterium]
MTKARLSCAVLMWAMTTWLLVPMSLHAQPYPGKPIRLIIPFPPSGATDVLGRTVVQKLGETLRQQVIVDNRPGASGVLGMELAARAPADGFTLVVGQASNLAIHLALTGKLPYDPLTAFAPISLIATTP